MKHPVYRIITAIALCSLFAAAFTYTRAMADNPADTHEQSNMCSVDTQGTATADEAPVWSEAVPASGDNDTLACTYASCSPTKACPRNHPAAPFACVNTCCVPL